MRSTIEFIVAGANVKRFHTVSTIQQETVGHHSHCVALLCTLFDPHPSRSLLMMALLHDLPEQTVGDIPSPAKRELNFSNQLERLENKILADGFGSVPDLTTGEAKTLKLADIGSGALFCLQEMRMGNSTIKKVFWRYIEYAFELDLDGYPLEFFNNLQEMANECQ